MLKPGQIIIQKEVKDNLVTFRLPQVDDAKVLMNYFNPISAERTFISFQGEQLSLEEEAEYLKKAKKQMERGETFSLMAFIEDDLVGYTSLRTRPRTENHILDLGITVAKKYRNQGIGTELIRQAKDLVKREIPRVDILILSVYSNNERAIHVYEKLGFQKFGTLPRGVKREDGYFDHDFMYCPLR